MPGTGKIPDTRQALPNGLRTRSAIAFTPEVAVKFADDGDELGERRFARLLAAFHHGTRRFPFRLFKHTSTWQVRALPAISTFRIENAKLAEAWEIYDKDNMLEQMRA